ncbi:MAG: hypothetical protein QM730_11335 [Anaerolineales bacterium]
MFADFQDVAITNQMPGFLRLVDILPFLKPVNGLLKSIDHATENLWGFYQVIEARK